MDSFDNLVMECKDIVSDHVNSSKYKKKSYNIYRLLHVTNKEVQMCRILADLLNPNGEHGEGAKYLIEFMAGVIKKDVPAYVLQDARVYTEYPITNDRRIDIVISYRGGFIPIEVKINAEDQKSQCYDYYHFSRKIDRNTNIVYLTKNGHRPSEYSVTSGNGDRLDESMVRCVSFESDIISWLEIIRSNAANQMIPFIDQYLGAVRDFVDDEEEDYKMKLAEKINSSECLRTSLEIVKTMDYVKADLMKKVFVEFEKQMKPLVDNDILEEETQSRWLHYNCQATEKYYTYKESTHPGLNYIIPSVKLGGQFALWLRIEVDYRLFAGLCIFDYGAKPENVEENGAPCHNISDSEWNNLCKFVDLSSDDRKEGWIITWRYLPTGSDDVHKDIDSVPNFKEMNEAAIKLADEEVRESFVKQSVESIKDTLLSLIK